MGEPYQVVEEGLCGRTAVFEDPLNEGLSGLAPLASILMSHSPLDLLVVMLGTNDCKERFSANAQNIADGLLRLVNKARTIAAWRDAPRILIVAPIVMDHRMEKAPVICDEMGRGSVDKSELPEKMRGSAKRRLRLHGQQPLRQAICTSILKAMSALRGRWGAVLRLLK